MYRILCVLSAMYRQLVMLSYSRIGIDSEPAPVIFALPVSDVPSQYQSSIAIAEHLIEQARQRESEQSDRSRLPG